MSITDIDKVDAIGIDRNTGEVVLNISDHLDWEDRQSHLSALEAKINAYLSFIEGGQLIEEVPEAEGRAPKIAVYCKFDLPSEITGIIRQLEQALSTHGIGFFYGPLPDGY